MKQKGFTLMELLAVILILAIIALIAVPVVLNIINNSRKNAFEISAKSYVHAIEQAIFASRVIDPTVNYDGTYTISNDGSTLTRSDNVTIEIEYKGTKITGGQVTVENSNVTSIKNLIVGGKYFDLKNGTLVMKEVLAPGLYDSNKKLLASWDELVNDYGLDVEKDYDLWDGSLSMMENILSNNNKLSTGSILVISNTVTSIGEQAFQDCSGLKEIIIPDSVTSIGSLAFYWSGLTKIIIPDSVTSLGGGAFEECGSLTSVTIPNSITTINSATFWNCMSLTELIIPSSVTSIGYEAFYNCRSLTEITIPDSVTSIDERAFVLCIGLTEVIISDSVISIGENAFKDCTHLEEAFFEETEGWSAGNTSISSSDLEDAETAATYLTTTYKSSSWTRTNSSTVIHAGGSND